MISMSEKRHSYQEVADALGFQLQAAYKRRRCGSVNTGWGGQTPPMVAKHGGRFYSDTGLAVGRDINL